MERQLRFQTVILILALVAATLAGLRTAYAAPAQSIDQDAQAALEALYAGSPGAKALGAKAKAVLVFPDIHKAGFIVGAQFGNGVMLKNGKAIGYYNVNGVLAGLEAGAQSFAYAVFFMSDAALDRLERSKGWEIGADPNIVVVDAGAAEQISTATLQSDVYAYVFNQKGLMGGVALQGMKITKIDR